MFYITLLFDLLQGQRGQFLSFLIVTLILYFSYYKSKLKLRSLLSIFIAIVFISQITLYIRQNFTSVSLFGNLLDFINQNGISTYVTSYSIYFKDELTQISQFYIFSPITDFIYRILIDRSIFYQGQTIELLNATNYLGHHLTYFVNEAGYINGNGTGTSFVAEILLVDNILLMNFMYFFYFYIIAKILRIIKKRPFFRPIYILLGIYFIYSPRSSYLKSISDVILLFIVMSTLLLLKTMLTNKDRISSMKA